MTEDLLKENLRLASVINPQLDWDTVGLGVMDLVVECRRSISDLYSRVPEKPVLERLIKPRDYERTIIWPSIIKILHTDDSSFSGKWVNDVCKLFSLWVYFTIIDKVEDREVSMEFLPDRKTIIKDLNSSALEWFVGIENSYKSDKLSVKSAKNYTEFLRLRYKPYGTYIEMILENVSNHTDNSCEGVGIFLSELLLIQQILDDIADWKEDSESGNVNWISSRVGEGKNEMEQKKIFILQVLPEEVNELSEVVSNLNKFTINDVKVQNYMEKLLVREENVIKELETLL